MGTVNVVGTVLSFKPPLPGSNAALLALLLRNHASCTPCPSTLDTEAWGGGHQIYMRVMEAAWGGCGEEGPFASPFVNFGMQGNKTEAAIV